MRLPALTFLILIAFSLVALKNNSFVEGKVWFDEAVSLERAQSSTAQLLTRTIEEDVHPPLYYLTLKGWLKITGVSLPRARALSVLLLFVAGSFLSLWMLCLNGPQASFIVTTLYITSGLAIYSSQYARMYPMLMLVCILASWAYFSIFFQNNKSRIVQIAFVLIHAIGFFAHFWFAFFVLAEGLTLIVMRREWMRFAILSIVSFLPFAILWLPYLPTQIKTSQESMAWIDKPSLTTVGLVLSSYCGWGMLIASLVTVPKIRASIIREWAKSQIVRASWVCCALCFLIPFALSFYKPIMFPRYTVIGLHLFWVPLGLLFSMLLFSRTENKTESSPERWVAS